MIRPWKGVLSAVVLGLVLLPSTAMAQGDLAGPTVTIVTPVEGATFTQGTPVNASFSCSDPSGVKDCVGSVADGAPINTSAVGNFTFTVVAHDTLDNPTTVTRNYSVQPTTGPIGGETPPTLVLTLGTPGAFSQFIPGLAREYSTTMTASVTSTAENVSLSVADPSTNATGRLVNGTFALAAPLTASASSTLNDPAANPPLTVPSPAGPVGGSASPLQLLTYNTPVGLDVATLTFKQAIGQTEALRTGGYSKTLTFTLSTTKP